jgi:ABC-type xylose transport system permease subunit
MTRPAGPIKADTGPDLTAAVVEPLPPELVSNSLEQYVRGWMARVRGGDAGVLPVIFALVILVILFQVVSPNHVFSSPGNLVNLFIQSSVFMVLAMAECFALLLGEIDLSIGYVAAVGGIVTAEAVQQPGMGWPWWAAIALGLFVCALIGALQGSLITRLRLPSFVVTLAGFLIWFGVMIVILGPAGNVSIASALQPDQRVLFNLVQGTIDPVLAWIGLAVIVGVFGFVLWWRDSSRRRRGLVAPSATSTEVSSCRSSAFRGSCPSSSPFSSCGPCCSSERSSGGTSMRWAATPKPPDGPASASPRSGHGPSSCARSQPASRV